MDEPAANSFTGADSDHGSDDDFWTDSAPYASSNFNAYSSADSDSTSNCSTHDSAPYDSTSNCSTHDTSTNSHLL